MPLAQLGEHMENLTDALYDYAVRMAKEVMDCGTSEDVEAQSYWVARVEISIGLNGQTHKLHRGAKLTASATEDDAALFVLNQFTERECPWEEDKAGPFDLYEMGDELVQVLEVVQVPRIQYQLFEEAS